MLSGLLPSKWVLLLIAALIVACGYLYLSKRIVSADLETKQGELEQTRRDNQLQRDAIDLLQKDAQVQAEAMRSAQQAIASIRRQALADALTIEQRNYGQEAQGNAKALEDEVNAQFQRLLDQIARISGQ